MDYPLALFHASPVTFRTGNRRPKNPLALPLLYPLVHHKPQAAQIRIERMNLIFILTMPGNNSWNGRWPGEGKVYAMKRKVSGKKAIELAGKSFGYNFGDGWYASVRCTKPDAAESRRLMKASQGFCGYQWMVDSIIQDGAIYGPTQPKPEKREEVPA